MNVNLGDLRHKISVQYNAQPDRVNSNGVADPDWQTLVSTMAKKEPLSLTRLGKYFYQASSDQAESDVVYTTRYREDIEPGMRILDGTRTLEIKIPPADPDGRRTWLLVLARELLQNG